MTVDIRAVQGIVAISGITGFIWGSLFGDTIPPFYTGLVGFSLIVVIIYLIIRGHKERLSSSREMNPDKPKSQDTVNLEREV